MKPKILRSWKVAVLGVGLAGAISLAPVLLQGQDHHDQDHHDQDHHDQDHRDAHNYRDKAHNDDHAWNGQEDRAYGIWLKDNHRKHQDFVKLKEPDQQSYWNWRHQHSDALLKIEIH